MDMIRSGATFAFLALASVACGGGTPDDEAPDVTLTGGVSDVDPRGEPQALSLLGEPLYAAIDSSGAVAAADSALAEAPDDVDLIIAAGRVRRNFQQYQAAIALYGRAVELAPDDWRPVRFRGHRHISLRQFEPAIRDLERARELAPANWDVAYHLGLAYFLSGRFADALSEYQRCLSQSGSDVPPDAGAGFRACAVNATDPESRVAMTEWAYRAARRSGADETADALLEGIAPDLDIQTNVAYYQDLLFYKGLRTAEELLEPGPDAGFRLETVGFGIANWRVAEGDAAAAVALLERLILDPTWSGFGRIAAEVEFVRLTGG